MLYFNLINVLKKSERNAFFVKMKTLLLIVFAFLLFTVGGNETAAGSIPARKALPDERIFGWTLLKTGGGWPCNPGAIWLNVGTSFFLINDFQGSPESSPIPLMVSADYSFQSHFAAGLYAGFEQVTFKDEGLGYRSRIRRQKFGSRLLLHGSDLLCDAFGFHFDTRVIDLYAVVSAGIEIKQKYYQYKGSSGFVYEAPASYAGNLALFFGARYIFKQRAGFFIEAGRGNFGILNAGFTLKIR
jgi:hypothetical protein